MRVGVGIGGLQACNIHGGGFNGNVSGFDHFQQVGAGLLVCLHDAGAEALLRLRVRGIVAVIGEIVYHFRMQKLHLLVEFSFIILTTIIINKISNRISFNKIIKKRS